MTTKPDILRLFLRMLSGLSQGYQIFTATSGVEALAALSNCGPDAMILDLLMPEMTGFELLQEKAKDPQLHDIPVIVASSLDPYNQQILSNQLFVTAGERALRRVTYCSVLSHSATVLAP